MDIELYPRPVGCLIIFLGLISFWIIPLMIRSRESVFPKQLSEEGIVTRAGKKVAWSELKKVQHLRYRLNTGGAVMEEYNFKTPKGRICFFSNRIKNFDAVMDYVWVKVPHLAEGQ
jgi:hypothetical protein